MGKLGEKSFVVMVMLIWLSTAAGTGWALTSEEIFSGFQFNLMTPGARATGLGASFIGLADDATAAVSNPAGLTLLIKPEISAELKYIQYHNKYFSKANDSEVIVEDFDDSVFSPSFFSFVLPYRDFSFSFYRHELANYKAAFQSDRLDVVNINPVKAKADMLIVDYGLAGAYRLNRSLSVGLSVKLSSLDLSTETIRYSNISGDIDSRTSVDDDDMAFGWNIGLLWKATERLSCGLVYKPGPKFSLQAESDENYTVPISWEEDFTLKVPDSYGVGLAYNALEQLTITFDVVHIEYSDLMEGFKAIHGGEDDSYDVNDVTEFHLGAEYVFFTAIPIAIRTGVYYDPDHIIEYKGDDEIHEIRFPGGDDTFHYTFGLGLVLSPNTQIDAACNVSQNNDQVSISGVYRF